MSSGQSGDSGGGGGGNSAMQAQIAKMGPPYPPQNHSLGSPPAPIPDVPLSVIFLVLFFTGAVVHMTLFQRNRKNGHKFLFSGAIFGFCMARTVSCALRIAWAYHQKNVRLAIAAQVFVAAGVVILFIINLFFTQRLMRARHPHIGWHAPFQILIPSAAFALTIIGIIMVIIVVVQSFYTLNPRTLQIDHHIQWAVLSYFTFVAFLPIPIVTLMLIIPRRTHIDKFGTGRYRTKICVLLASSALLTLGAGFRCGTTFVSPTPSRAPTPWYYTKAAFYCFDFLVEILVVIMYAVVRVDRRFHVPDHAKGHGAYSAEIVQEKPTEEEKDVYVLNPDGRSLSLPGGTTYPLAGDRDIPMVDRASISRPSIHDPPPTGADDVDMQKPPSIDSQSHLSTNDRSGKHATETKSGSDFGIVSQDSGPHAL